MFDLERDQQNDDPALQGVTTFPVLKDRYTGQATGKTVFLGYDAGNGRLVPSDGPEAAFKDESKGGANPDF